MRVEVVEMLERMTVGELQDVVARSARRIRELTIVTEFTGKRCPSCKGDRLQKAGVVQQVGRARQRVKCLDCGRITYADMLVSRSHRKKVSRGVSLKPSTFVEEV